MRLVLDTNVMISALLFPRSKPEAAFRFAFEQVRIFMSSETIDELVRVLQRPKLDRYLSPDERRSFLIRLLQDVERVAVEEKIVLCRDPADDKFLEVAAAGEANWLITGDADLLVLGSVRRTRIATPGAFLDAVAG